MSIGSNKSSSRFTVREFPSQLLDPKNPLSKLLLGGSKEGIQRLISGTDLGAFNLPGQGAVSNQLESELLNPTFGAQNQNERAFLGSLQELTGGASALRGLGPATQGGLAQVLAPALMQLRNQRLQNLSGRAAQETTQRGQDIQGTLGARSQQLDSLRTLIEGLGGFANLGAPERIAGNTSSSSGFSFGL